MALDLSSTSSTSSSLSSLNNNNINNNNNNNNISYIIIIILLIIGLYYIFNNKMEKMTAGTLTQLFANDSQDTYLKSNVDSLATGNFNLYWNQPTRIANTFLNRGSPVPSSYFEPAVNELPFNTDTMMHNQSNNNRKEVMKEIVNTNGCAGGCSNPNACVKKCINNPSSCGGGAGGYRLETGFVDATSGPKPIIVDKSVIYPDSYVGSYFINPIPDINEPYPVILDKV